MKFKQIKSIITQYFISISCLFGMPQKMLDCVSSYQVISSPGFYGLKIRWNRSAGLQNPNDKPQNGDILYLRFEKKFCLDMFFKVTKVKRCGINSSDGSRQFSANLRLIVGNPNSLRRRLNITYMENLGSLWLHRADNRVILDGYDYSYKTFGPDLLIMHGVQFLDTCISGIQIHKPEVGDEIRIWIANGQTIFCRVVNVSDYLGDKEVGLYAILRLTYSNWEYLYKVLSIQYMENLGSSSFFGMNNRLNNILVMGDYSLRYKFCEGDSLKLYGFPLPNRRIGYVKTGKPGVNDVIKVSEGNRIIFFRVKKVSRGYRNIEFCTTCELLVDSDCFSPKLEIESIKNLGRLMFKGNLTMQGANAVCYGDFVGWYLLTGEQIVSILPLQASNPLPRVEKWFIGDGSMQAVLTNMVS